MVLTIGFEGTPVLPWSNTISSHSNRGQGLGCPRPRHKGRPGSQALHLVHLNPRPVMRLSGMRPKMSADGVEAAKFT